MDNLTRLYEIFDHQTFEKLLNQTARILSEDLAAHVNGQIKVNSYTPPEEEYTFWSGLAEAAAPLPWAELLGIILERSIRIQNPGFIGHQVTAAAPLAAIGGLVSDFLNNGMGVYEMGTTAVALERIIIEWVTSMVGYGAHRGGFLTSGGSLANLTALLSARNAWRRHHPREQVGKLGVLISAQAHYSVERAIRILDMEVIKVPVEEKLTIQVDQLENVWLESREKKILPIAMVASAGTTATGSFDDLEQIAKFCIKNSIWLHVDGAHGGSVIFSEKYRHLAQGIHGAQSVSIDFHKMLMTPALCTVLVFKDPNDSYQTYIHQASYLFENEQEEWFNIAKRSFECTKFMMSLKVFLLKYYYGNAGFNAYIENQFDLGRQFGQLVKNTNDFELLLEPVANIVCFRFVDQGYKNTKDLNNLNAHIRQKLLEQGDFYIVQTTLNDALWLRCTFMNPFSNQQVQQKLLDEIRAIAKTIKI